MANCRSCKAEIIWALTEGAKREPLDAVPVPNGNIEITGKVKRHLEDGSIEETPTVRHLKKGEGDVLPGMEPPALYVSHFATCPDAKKWKG